MLTIKGIHAPVPTAFHEDGTLCEEGFKKNLEFWAVSPLDGIIVSGSNGELPFLTREDRMDLTRWAREAAPKEIPILCGAHFPSTRETIECAKAVADCGADAVLVLPPHYFKGQGMEGAKHYFNEVADASPIPVVLYNMPANTGVNLEFDAILALSEHPNIVGVKDTSGDITKLSYLCARAPEGFAVFCGSGNYYLAALACGVHGGTLGVSNIYPGACKVLENLFKENKIEEAKKLQHRILFVSDAVTRRFGVPGLKCAMDSLGLYGGPCRSPLMPVGPAVREEILALLKEARLDEFESRR